MQGGMPPPPPNGEACGGGAPIGDIAGAGMREADGAPSDGHGPDAPGRGGSVGHGDGAAARG